MALTNFNNIKAAEIQLKLDQLWKDPQYDKSYTPRANALKTILENQTVTVEPLETPDKLRDVKVKWVDFCGDSSADGAYDDDCATPAGAEGAGKTQTYALDTFPTDKYAVSEEELETAIVSFDEIVAIGLAAKIKNILERANAKVVAAVEANKGDNPYITGPYNVDNVANFTEVPATDFGGEKLIPYLAQVSELNRSSMTYLLDGGNLFQDYYVAEKKALNADGKLANALYQDLPFRHDLFGFAANNLADSTYLIDKGALAIANRAKFPALKSISGTSDGGWIHTDTGSFMRYSIPLNIPTLPAMTFVSQGALKKQVLLMDIQYAKKCTATKIIHNWFMKLRFAILANPVRCDANNTGIIKFKKVAA
jgi:hypothetical protein